MKRLCLFITLLCLGAVAAADEIDFQAAEVLKAIEGKWTVKGMYCAASGVDVFAQHKAANISQTVEINNGMIIETSHYKSCNVSSELKVASGKFLKLGFSTYGNSQFIKIDYEHKRTRLVKPNGESGCEVAPLVQEAEPTQDIFTDFTMDLQHVTPGTQTEGTKLERIVLTGTTWHTKDLNKYCEPSDIVITTLVREK